MKNNNYSCVSIIGRIAYGAMCVEAYLKAQYPLKNWNLLCEKIWKITTLEYWDDWMDEIIEIIPENFCEISDYDSAEFEYLSKGEYIALKSVYQGIGEDVNKIIRLYERLANAHAYSSIIGVGDESLEALERIIEFLNKAEIKLPEDSEILKHKFSENQGWGDSFDGTKLSIIL